MNRPGTREFRFGPWPCAALVFVLACACAPAFATGLSRPTSQAVGAGGAVSTSSVGSVGRRPTLVVVDARKVVSRRWHDTVDRIFSHLPVSATVEANRKAGAATNPLAPTAASTGAAVGDGSTSTQASTPKPTTSFEGLSAAQTCRTCEPPDQGLAASSSWVVQAVNSSVAVYSASGTLQSGWPKVATDLFKVPSPAPAGCAASGAVLFDPRAFYDTNDGRFWVSFEELEGYEFDTSCRFASHAWVAVSQTSDPRGLWNIYSFDLTRGTSNWGDYVTLGFDSQAVYYSANMFDQGTPDPHFKYAEVCEANKAKMEAASTAFTPYCFTQLSAGGGLVDTVQPVATEAPAYGPQAEFLVSSFDFNFGGGQCTSSCSGVTVWSFSNPIAHDSGGSNPLLASKVASTPSYTLAPQADQPGCSKCIDTLDPRISATPVYRAGSLWAALETGVNNGTRIVPGIFWFQLRPVLGHGTSSCALCTKITAVSVEQSGYFSFPGDQAASYPALMTDDESNLFMVFDTMSATLAASMGLVARRATESPGVFPDAGKLVRTGDAASADDRWGDYEAASYTSRTSDGVWVSAQYAPADGTWATRIAKVKFTLSIS